MKKEETKQEMTTVEIPVALKEAIEFIHYLKDSVFIDDPDVKEILEGQEYKNGVSEIYFALIDITNIYLRRQLANGFDPTEYLKMENK